jgi:hypothetical protein
MTLLPKNLGAEPKKVIVLGVLVLIAIVAYFINRTSDSPGSQAANVPRANPLQPIPAVPAVSTTPMSRRNDPSSTPMQRAPGRGGVRPTEDFRPSLKPKEGVDISSIDPTLHLDRLAKLHNLAMEGGARSVFKEGSAPAPPPPQTVTIKPGTMSTSNNVPAPVTPTPTAGPPPPPPPTPIPLKFYGFVNPSRGGSKRAFFLDGDDIHIAGENEVIRNRYKIIRIGVNSAVVEDTTDKHQQTLPLVEEFAG